MFYVDTISIDVEMCAVVLPKLRTKMKTKTIFRIEKKNTKMVSASIHQLQIALL